MKIDLIAVGTRMPKWVELGVNEYAKRLSTFCQLNMIEIPSARTKEIEADKILRNISSQHYAIALDVEGEFWHSQQFAQELQNAMLRSSFISFLIGGPDGLARNCLARANKLWSLSALTFPHMLVRIMVIEQIYRAFSILRHHPYHRE
jgi:23S rRNA (pseudouridine1915-N3)-methyltransferase